MKKYRYFIVAMLLNVLLLWNFYTVFDKSQQVSAEELNVVTGKIESIALTSGGRYSTRHINIKVNSEVYNLYKMSSYEKIDFDDIFSKLKIGDDIELTYVNKFNFILIDKVIVDLNVNDNQYQTLNDYNDFHSGSNIVLIVTYVFIELFIILFSLFYLWCLK